jgi:hypothetical protein
MNMILNITGVSTPTEMNKAEKYLGLHHNIICFEFRITIYVEKNESCSEINQKTNYSVARCAPAAATVQFWGLIYF